MVVPPGPMTIYVGGQNSVDVDVVQGTDFFVEGADLATECGAIASELASDESPLVSAA